MARSIYDVIIIGLGPAGMAAGIYCARKGLKTLILGKEVGGQVAKTGAVENYLGFGQATGAELTNQFDEHLESFKNVEHHHNIEVTNIVKKKANLEVITNKNDKIETRSIIICSGRNPKRLNVPGESQFLSKGVTYCEVCDAPLFQNRITAVIGGGNSALEAALSLSKLCPQVYILNITSKLSGDKISQDKLKNLKNVKILNNVQTVGISGDQFVSGLKYKDFKTGKVHDLKVQGVFIEIGWEPSISFDNLTKKDKWSQIIIDKQCQTNIQGIFAAGDVTDVGFYQIIVAAGEGAKAALAAAQYLTKKK